MKQLTSPSCKQQGFTLLESLVALVIFSIIVLGSGAAISKMLNVQRNMNVDGVLITAMQTRLQNALSGTHTSDICASVNTTKLTIGKQDYFFACSTEKIDVDSTEVKWPVLAASTNQATADACASNTSNNDCFVVGR